MTRVLVAVAVAALVVLAGCSGGPTTSTTPNATDDSPTEPTTSDSNSKRVTVPSDLVAPGGNKRGVKNARSLLMAHLGALSNTSYESSVQHTKLYRQGRFGTTGETTYNLTVSDGGAFTSTHVVASAGNRTRTDSYTATESVFVRRGDGSATTYQYGTGPVALRLQQYGRPAHPGVNLLFTHLQIARGVQATGFDTVNGEKVVRYEARRFNQSTFASYGSILGAPKGTLEDHSLTLYVDTDGVVHRAAGSMTIERANGETRNRSFTYGVSNLGSTSVSEPAWTSEVPRVNGSLNGANTLLSVENVGSVPMSNYSTTVAGNVRANVTVNGTLAPNETAYVYATDEGNDTVLHVTETKPDVPSDARVLVESARGVVYFGTADAAVSLGVFKNTSGNGTQSDTRHAPNAAADGGAGSTRLVHESSVGTQRIEPPDAGRSRVA